MLIEFNEATPDNWQVYAGLRSRCLRDEGHAMGQPYSAIEGWGEAEWRDALQKADRHFFVLHVDGVPVGTMGLKKIEEEGQQRAHLIAAYIVPEHRGKKYSLLLYREILSFIRRALPITYVTVDHREGNTASGRAIQGSGFTATGATSERTFGDGSRGMLVIYELRL